MFTHVSLGNDPECKEATLLRELRQENIVQLNDCFTRRSTLYLVFEFVEQVSQTLSQNAIEAATPGLLLVLISETVFTKQQTYIAQIAGKLLT